MNRDTPIVRDITIVRDTPIVRYTILIQNNSLKKFKEIPFKNVINTKLKCGKNLFWIACYFGAYDIVKYIFETYYELLKQKILSTTEFINLSNISISRVQYLFDFDEQKISPMYIAIKNKHFKIVEYLKEKGFSLNIIQPYSLFIMVDNKFLEKESIEANIYYTCYDTYLYTSCKLGDLDVLKYLFQNTDFKKNIKTYNINSLVSIASKFNHLEVVKFLIENKIKYAKNINHPILDAIKYNRMEIVNYFLSIINPIKISFTGKSLLHFAAEYGNFEFLKQIINCGINIDIVCYQMNTPLILACKYGHFGIVQFLVENNANINITNKYDYTAIKYAAFQGHINIFQYLINKGAKIANNFISKNYFSIKYENSIQNFNEYKITQIEKRFDILKFIINKLNFINFFDIKIIIYAYKMKYDEIGKFLIKNGVKIDFSFIKQKKLKNQIMIDIDSLWCFTLFHKYAYCNDIDRFRSQIKTMNSIDEINIMDSNGWTPFHIACYMNNKETVELLLDSGINYNIITQKTNFTGLHLACSKGHVEIIKIISNHIKNNTIIPSNKRLKY
jgi:ankyrin repeat protein